MHSLPCLVVIWIRDAHGRMAEARNGMEARIERKNSVIFFAARSTALVTLALTRFSF